MSHIETGEHLSDEGICWYGFVLSFNMGCVSLKVVGLLISQCL